MLGPGGEEVSHRCDVCFGGGQIRVPEAGQGAEHLREDVQVEAPIDLGGLSEEIFLGEVLRELDDVGEVASLGPVERGNDLAARQLTGCESRADEAGVAGCSGGESSARSTRRSSLPWMTRRQNVASSRTFSMVQPRS